MYKVEFKNGYYNVTSEDQDLSRFEWLTFDENSRKYYFHANHTTRRLFRDQMLRDPNCVISAIDREYLQHLNLSHKINRDTTNLILPNLGPGKQLKDYQIESVKRMLTHRNYCLFLGAGTGKTLIAITYLNNAKPRKVLILTPKSVIGQYLQEIKTYINYSPDIVVTNYEEFVANEEGYLKNHYDCVILDESHKAKNYMSNINKSLRSLSKTNTYLFTGTPMDKNRHEIAMQIAIFDKRFVPTKTKFINRYFILDDYFNPSREKKEFSAELTELLNLVSWGKESEEILTLTEAIDHKIEIPKPTMYDELYKDRIINRDGILCVCDTPSKLAIKLREICNGYLIDDNKNVIETNSTKAEELGKLIKEMKNGIIYTQFDLDIKIVEKVLDSAGRTYMIINGAKSKKQRETARTLFLSGEFDFLVMQAASGNAGLDLTNTSNTIFFSLPTSYIIYEQCCRRTRRMGQKEDCHYFYLLCEKSVETHILKLLKKKKAFSAYHYRTYRGEV